MSSDGSADQNDTFHHGSRLEADDPQAGSEQDIDEDGAQPTDNADADELMSAVTHRTKPKNAPAPALDAISEEQRSNAPAATRVSLPIRLDLTPSTALRDNSMDHTHTWAPGGVMG